MRIGSRGLAAGALALAALALGGGGVAQAQSGPVLENGKTKAVYNYKTAIRERVFIPQPGIDQDRNGQMDWVTADIIRPAEGTAANKIPAIIDPSQCMADWDNDGLNDRWPLFLDNYFIPRGYAYVLGQMNGTGYTTNGCPMHGGPGDIAGEKSIVDWLNGRVKAYKTADLTSPQVVADWHNGSSAMIGKSYDGTLSNGVAATGVEGLKTIVPVSAISSWYLYSRTGGIRNNTNYPGGSLNPTVTTAGGTNNPPGVTLPERRTLCAPVNADISNDANVDTGDGDAHGDINTFWNDRDYVKDASKVKAAVFATHGFQDDNVRMDHEYNWQQALKANGVKTKLWLLRAGHTDPFESRRAEWVNTLHRWFDHYLYGVNNGIENEPAVTIEDEKDVWNNYASWPIPGTENVNVFLRGTADNAAAGSLGGSSGGAADTVNFTGTAGFANETTIMNTPTGTQANRRTFLSRPLTKDVRLSGQASFDIVASVPGTQENYGALLVDYGAGTQVTRNGEGISNTTTRTCWGDTGTGGPACNVGEPCTASVREIDTACYLEVTKPTQSVTQWRVTRGTLDSSNRNSLFYTAATPLTPNTMTRITFPTFATEHIFKAGHQIGIVIVGNLFGANASGTAATSASPAQPITIDTKLSKVILPIQGGYAALASAQGTDAETVAPVIGTMPADITVSTANPQGTVVNYTPPTATDNEDPNPTVTCVKASGSLFAVGQNTVVCTARDSNGNTSSKTFTIMVKGLSEVGGSVPATLSLTLGAAVQFGAFTPGVAKDYTAGTTATVISTAGDATLSVADPSSVATGRLVNGTFALATPLQGLGTIKTWSAPTSNESVPITFKQSIAANEPLRTGTYSKTLTFTLSTTTP